MGRLSGIVSALARLFGAEEEWFRENSPESGPNPRFDPSLGELLLHAELVTLCFRGRNASIESSNLKLWLCDDVLWIGFQEH